MSAAPPAIGPAREADIGPAVAMAARAFAQDPLMAFFFGPPAPGRGATVARFFTLLMTARVRLGAPALVLRGPEGIGGGIGGLAMGYATTMPDWPPAMVAEFEAWEATIPGLTERFAAYSALADRHVPQAPHYYLGVLAVDPAGQGRGHGRALVDAFAALAAADPAATGVYLETASPRSLAFYRAIGFRETGDGPLGEQHLWCLFRDLPRA